MAEGEMIVMDYESMLNRADEKIDREQMSEERYNIPTAEILNQGNFTIISNFTDLVKALRREPSHMMKFLLRELAVPGELKGGRLTLQGRFSQEQINKKVDLYVNNFVLCAQCGKPDTHLETEEGLTKMKCEACKAKRVVRSIK